MTVTLAVLAASAPAAFASEISVSSILCADSTAKPTWVPIGSPGDANRNGAVCVKGKKAVDELRIISVTMSIESAGCSSGSYVVSSSLNPVVDSNQNEIVCYAPTGKGSWSDDLASVTALSIQ